MAQPTPYTRQYNLASVQSGNSLIPIPGSYLDTELDAVKNTLDQTLANLALIQRDDGALANGIVSLAALSGDVKALMAAGVNVEGPWVTATSYVVGAIVENGSSAYMCLVAHTSGASFAADLALGKWVILTGTVPADDTISTVKIQNLAVTTGKLAADAVTFAKMQNITSDRLLGRDTASSGDTEEISLDTTLEWTGAQAIRRAALTGDVTAAAGSNATTIAAGVVTYAKMQDISATKRVVGRNTAAAGDAEEVSLTQLLDWIGTVATGDLPYRGASAWDRLAAGTAGMFLTQGASIPAWAWGGCVQEVAGLDPEVATGTTAIPYDDSVPTSTEGDQYMSISITPKSAGHTLLVDVNVHISHSASTPVTVALFRDAEVGALGATTENCTAGEVRTIRLHRRLAAGSTSAQTFKVRIGGATGATLTFNGAGGARRLGGVGYSSLRVQEISV